MAPLIIRKPNSCRILTQDQVAALKQRSADQERKLNSLDMTINHLRNRLSQLSAQQKMLNEEVEVRKAFIAPIRRLLPEILQEIFIHCLPSAHNAVMSGKQAPLLLCRVCHRWRQIAYATPHLWASIHIVIPSTISGLHTRKPSLQDISFWLRRSGALPLSISASIDSFVYYGYTDDGLRSYFNILLPFACRWKSLHFSAPSFDFAEYFSNFKADDLPLLESVHIDGGLDVDDQDDGANVSQLDFTSIANGILRAPRLRSLSLPLPAFRTLQSAISWDNLIRLGIMGGGYVHDFDDIIRILPSCHNLEVCSISGLETRTFIESPASMSRRIELPKLYSLSITDWEPFKDTLRLFKALYCPQLRHLRYEIQRLRPLPHWQDDPFRDRRFRDIIPTFLSRLTRPLEELDLIVASCDVLDFREVLSFFPDLKRLSLREALSTIDHWHLQDPTTHFHFADSHLRSLTPKTDSHHLHHTSFDGGSDDRRGHLQELDSHLVSSEPHSHPACLCPKLEVFQCVGAIFSDAVLADFVRSRSGSAFHNTHTLVGRLRKVDIVAYPPPVDPEFKSKTRKFIRELRTASGMTVDVTFEPPLVYPLPPVEPRYSPYNGSESLGVNW